MGKTLLFIGKIVILLLNIIDMLCSICYNTYMKDYDFCRDIKLIRMCLDMSQADFAEQVGLSRSNIARYESGQIKPRFEASERIFNYAYKNDFDINSSKAMIYDDKKKGKTILFHGARGTIDGEIDTKHSIAPNDFGDGFYLGQTLKQASMWVAAYKQSSVYCFYLKDLKEMNIMHFEVNYEWMLAILYYRQELEGYQLPEQLKKLIKDIEMADIIIAPIADNQMYDTIEAFRNNLISDVACLHALSANNLGHQFVLKSQKACSKLEAVDRLYLCQEERNEYLSQKEKTAAEGRNKTSLTISKYRKEGRLFNEIFKEER